MSLLSVVDLSARVSSSFSLEEVSFEINKGEIILLAGPNGSGKSSLLRFLSGIATPQTSSGFVKYQEQAFALGFRDLSTAARAQRVTYVGGDLRAHFPITAYQVVSLGMTCWNLGAKQIRDEVRRVMDLCGCLKWKDRELRSLSSGERQLVALAKGLAQKSPLLFLDESISGMDLNHQALIGKMLRHQAKELGLGIVLVAHDVNLGSEWADRAVCLKDGKKIFEGPVSEFFTAKRFNTLYPGTHFIEGANPSTGAPKIFFK